MYPESGQQDVVEAFAEDDTFAEHLDMVWRPRVGVGWVDLIHSSWYRHVVSLLIMPFPSARPRPSRQLFNVITT